MKRFRFSLQSVLGVRKAKADQVAAALAETQRTCCAHLDRLTRLREAEGAVLAELAAGRQSESEPWDLSAHHTYLRGLGEQIKSLEAQLAAEREKEARLRDTLVERMKEKRMMTQLKKRKFDEHRAVLAREEQLEIDERAGGRRTSRGSRESLP
jgi:flagellar export protein FliJ